MTLHNRTHKALAKLSSVHGSHYWYQTTTILGTCRNELAVWIASQSVTGSFHYSPIWNADTYDVKQLHTITHPVFPQRLFQL